MFAYLALFFNAETEVIKNMEWIPGSRWLFYFLECGLDTSALELEAFVSFLSM